MNPTGGLKKRRRRNLSKVAGLSIIPYDEASDTYRGLDLYSVVELPSTYESVKANNDASYNLTMSRIHDAKQSGRITSSNRITRDPSFSLPYNESKSSQDDYTATEVDGMTAPRPVVVWNEEEKSIAVNERPYLLNKRTLTRLRQLLILGLTSGAFPWSWNKKKHRIDKWGPRMERLWSMIWILITIQTTVLTGFQIYSFFKRVSGGVIVLYCIVLPLFIVSYIRSNKISLVSHRKNWTYREIFLASLSVYWYVCAIYFNFNMYLYKDLIRQYINNMFAMNKKYVEKHLVNIDGYKDGGQILINLSIPSNCSQVFASVALFLVMPFQPWYMYSTENPWYWLIPGAIQEFVVVGQVITNYMLTSWIVVAHTNSVDFWLREIHNHNDTGYTMEEIRQPKAAIEMYRSLQILCT